MSKSARKLQPTPGFQRSRNQKMSQHRNCISKRNWLYLTALPDPKIECFFSTMHIAI